ncbi:MAG: SDR family NAD(P)-dependent oxidoreductase [bacterium]|nr:SDR family NAD(P)-dependent oxidoreductase [bacterium]
MKLSGKKILITGASSGIGAATAVLAAAQGGEMILQARSRDKLDQVADRIASAGGTGHVYPVDAADNAAVESAAAKIKTEVGVPDVIINCAGAGRWLFADETSGEEARQMMDAPYFAAFFTTRAFLPEMIARKSGHIININSAACFFAFPGATGYISARWALRGFNDALREDLHTTGVKVSMVAPGKVATPYFETNEGAEDRIPGIVDMFYPTLTSEQVARTIVKTIRSRKKTVVPPLLMSATVALNPFMPGVIRWLMRKTGAKR